MPRIDKGETDMSEAMVSIRRDEHDQVRSHGFGCILSTRDSIHLFHG